MRISTGRPHHTIQATQTGCQKLWAYRNLTRLHAQQQPGAPCGSCRRASKRSSSSGPAATKSRSPAVRRRAEVNAWPESLRSAVRRSVPFATAALAGADVYHCSSLFPQPARDVHVAHRAVCRAMFLIGYRPAWRSHALCAQTTGLCSEAHRSILHENVCPNALQCFSFNAQAQHVCRVAGKEQCAPGKPYCEPLPSMKLQEAVSMPGPSNSSAHTSSSGAGPARHASKSSLIKCTLT